MTLYKYTKEERDLILTNPNVSRCGVSGITFKMEFKLKAVKDHAVGKSPTKIFNEAGITLELVKKHRNYPIDCINGWKEIYRKKGEEKMKTGKQGILKKKKVKLDNLSKEEKLKYLEAQVEYLTAENSFLAQLRAKK